MTSYQPIHVWPELAPYVVAIQVECESKAAMHVATAAQVMPTALPVLGFQYRGRLAVIRDGCTRPLDRSGITVLQSVARTFVPADDARSVLVTLQPAAAFRLLGWPMHELADQHLGLTDLLSPAAVREVEDRLQDARSADERGAIVQRHLLTRLTESSARPHPVIEEATLRLLVGGGRQQIRPLAADLGVSERQLERLFREQIGTNPKQFASLARFEWAWRRTNCGLSWAALASEAGYADQAHLTRTFVQRTGLPPSRLLAQTTPATW